MGINVLSLFDGMSCGQQALERAGIEVDNYFASEIDKYAMQVTMANYPDTKQLGSVVNVNGADLPKIDLLIGGSPCQSFSFAGKRKGMATKCETEILTLNHYLELKSDGYEFEGQSYLFWEFMRLLNECKPKYFLLENVEMGEKWEKVLSKAIGVNGIHINSALVSAQNRKRIYWTNIGMQPGGLFGDLVSIIEKPKDKGILLKDVLETEVDKKYYLSDKMILYFNNRLANFNNGKINIRDDYEKSSCLTSSMASCDISDNYIKIDKKGKMILGCDYRKDEGFRFRDNGKSNTLMARAREDIYGTGLVSININTLNENQQKKFNLNINSDKTNALTLAQGKAGISNEYMDAVSKNANITRQIRRLTPLECERLQTVKDNYTNHVSDSQRYKMLGNGWTVDVIAHIFSYLK